MPASSAALDALRARLDREFPAAMARRDAARLAGPVASGIAPLDAALRGGFPRGQLTAWTPGGGVHTVLQSACLTLRDAGERAAWVHSTGVVPFGWAVASPTETPTPNFATRGRPSRALRADGLAVHVTTGQPLLVQTADRREAFRAALILVEAGAFALVVLEVSPGQEAVGKELVHLTRAARAGGAAFVAITPVPSLAALRVTSRLLTHAAPRAVRAAASGDGEAARGAADAALGVVWTRDPFGAPAYPVALRARVRVRAPGWSAETTLAFGLDPYDVRGALEPGVDRRGARTRAADPGAGDAAGVG